MYENRHRKGEDEEYNGIIEKEEGMIMQTNEDKKWMLWSNMNLDIDDYREVYKEFVEENEYDLDINNENDIYNYMNECNEEEYSWLKNDFISCVYSQPVVVLADVGTWRGCSNGYRIIESGRLSDCFYFEKDCELAEWYLDKNGDLCSTQSHHDGTHYLMYRVFKENISEKQIEHFLDIYCKGEATRDDITRYTKRLGDEIAREYGLDIPRLKKHKEIEM